MSLKVDYILFTILNFVWLKHFIGFTFYEGMHILPYANYIVLIIERTFIGAGSNQSHGCYIFFVKY